ncbi:hypothetical protein GKC56_07220 [Neisseriaceae bacterium PsAf]|nr:hypothetical protein [Neisseriaceae bacterium PsAf]MCV2503665.1 lipocalin family protein [Neisseriaceae bacterium]
MVFGEPEVSNESENTTQESIDIIENPKIDLSEYLGKWYEIAVIPYFFERNCDSNTTAEYSLKKKNVRVLNSCLKKNGELIQSEGTAFVADSVSNNKLKVSFLPSPLNKISFFRADYWILAIEKNYQSVLVGNPNKKYLWILSRDKNMSQEEFERYINIAKKLGYDTKTLVKTKQN